MSAPSSKKGSNRVKGNLKPSSSSQAAQLLSGQASGFIGFGGQSVPSFVPLSQMLDDVDSTLDSDIRLILRKLSKRDSITKIKALQELGEICHQKDAYTLKSMLPFWPRLYNKLAMDLDYKVREAVHQTFLVIISKVGKEIAPYLKAIMGCWVVCQCDTYPTVASVANQVFQETFPSGKQNDALIAYRQDIFDYLVDNLVNQTPQSLSDPKITSPEDMENKYTRVVSSSFSGSRKLLGSVPVEKLSSLEHSLTTLLENGKFWKHGKSAVANIKSGAYSFLAIVCQRFPKIVGDHISKFTPFILHNLDISNPVIVGPMWESILSLVNYVPECWEHVSWMKAFWPKLKKCLEKGCYGNASTISPSIMPLISKVPDTLFGDRTTFYTQFLASFREGFHEESILNSNIECAALVRSFVECCHYTVNQAIANETSDDQFPTTVMEQYVLEFVKYSVVDVRNTLATSPVYTCVGRIMKSLEKSPKGAKLSKLFWIQLKEFVYLQLDSGTAEQTIRIGMLIKGFLTSSSGSKKSVNVKFGDAQMSKRSPNVIVDTELLSTNFTGFYTQILCHIYQKSKSEGQQTIFLSLFAEFFDLFITGTILKNILSEQDKISDNMYVCYLEAVCFPGLKTFALEKSENILSMSFKCLENIQGEEGLQLFSKLIEHCEDLIQYCIVIETLVERRKYYANAKIFLNSSCISEMILSLVKLTCLLSTESKNIDNVQQIERGWTVITMILSSCGEEDSVFADGCVEAVLLAIGDQLSAFNKITSSATLNQAIQLVTRAACSFFDNLKDLLCPTATEELMATLFSISLDSTYKLEPSAVENCEFAWTKGLKLLINCQGNDLHNRIFIGQACKILNRVASSKDCSLDKLNRVLKYVNIILNLVAENVDEDSSVTSSLVAILFEKLFIDEADVSRNSLLLCKIYISRDLLSILEHAPVSILTNIAPCDVLVTINQATFNINLLEFLHQKITATDSFKKSTLKVVHAFSVAERLIAFENQIFTKDLMEPFKNLKMLMCQFVSSLTETEKKSVLQEAISLSTESGKIHSVLLHSLLEILVPEYCCLNEKQMIERWTEISNGTLHTIQAVLPFFSCENIHSLVELQTGILLSSLSTTNDSLGFTSLAVVTSCLNVLTFPSNSKFEFDIKSLTKSVLGHLLSWREIDDNFLVSSDEDFNNMSKVVKNIEVMKFLTLAVEVHAEYFTDKEWDFILCCLVDWIQRIKICESGSEISILSATFISAACDLLLKVAKCMDTNVSINSEAFPGNLFTEWEEFFSEGIFGTLIPVYVTLANETICDFIYKAIIIAIGKSLSYCNSSQALKHKLPTYLSADDDSSLTPDIQTFLNHISPFLLNSEISIQTTAYNLLEKLVNEVTIEYQKSEDDISSNSEEACTKSPPMVLMDIIRKGGDAMDVILTGFTMGNHLVIEPNTEEYQFTCGYILAWRLILYFFKTADPQMRAMYATYLRDEQLFSKLLRHIFCLLPLEKNTTLAFEFNLARNLDLTAHIKCSDIQQQAFSLYYQCLEITPALVRQWWMDLDRKTSIYVDKFTSKYASPQLCTEEISSVQPSDDLEGITIKPRPSTREVVATYIMAEVKIVVTITLPENFPLGVIAVSSDKRVGATQAQWDRWLLQLNIFLQHQNGTIIEGLKLWKKNIDKRFDGVEDCMICFSVLHGTTFQLPKLQCRTCKKKYHSACLYKWFSTSMNSTCPLCRNLF